MVLPVTSGDVSNSFGCAAARWQLTSLDEDLHTSTEAQDKMQGGFLLDVVVGQRATILQLLSGEDKALLVRRDALLVLDLALYVVDGVGGLDLKGDGLSGDCEPSVTEARQRPRWRRAATYGS